MTPKLDIDALARLYAEATPGPWQLQDGCSWRRIGTPDRDGAVLCPSTYSREDNHPDLTAGRGEDLYANLRLIVAAVNNLETLLACARLVQEIAGTEFASQSFARDIIERCREVVK